MNEIEQQRATGSCLCGSVRFAVRGDLRPVSFCHCLMCQRSLTNYGAYTACSPDALDLLESRALKWYRSSPEARRGFCGKCGSQLFWEPTHGRSLSVSAGSLDQPAALTGGEHIFCDQSPDYCAGPPR